MQLSSDSVRKLRPLTVQDVEAVTSMCQDVHDGLDYLPGVLESWIEGANVSSLGLEQNGILVAVVTAHFIGDKQTAIIKGLRVHSNNRGKGIGSLLTSAILEKVCRECPTVTRFINSCESHNKAQLKIMADWNQILCIGYVCAEFRKDTLQSASVSTLLTADSQLQPMSSPELCSLLFPERPTFLPSFLFGACFQNVLTEDEIEKSVLNGHLWLVKMADDRQVASVSIGSHMSTPVRSVTWLCDVYGCSKDDIYFHVVEQLKKACQTGKGDPFLFECSVPEQFADYVTKTVQKMAYLRRSGFSVIVKEKRLG
eukprot:m.11278 g.11278  ORF g.11278 m.11278 type:complete len:312 (+) comp23131_c0_seq3:90-1025(+)